MSRLNEEEGEEEAKEEEEERRKKRNDNVGVVTGKFHFKWRSQISGRLRPLGLR